MDKKISFLNQEYKKGLGRYQYFLKCKNVLLSSRPNQFREQIRSIHREMAPLSVFLTQKRKYFLQELEPFLSKAFFDIFSEECKLDMILDSPFLSLEERDIFKFFENRAREDESRGHMTSGIHRDDYMLLFNGLNVGGILLPRATESGFFGPYICLYRSFEV